MQARMMANEFSRTCSGTFAGQGWGAGQSVQTQQPTGKGHVLPDEGLVFVSRPPSDTGSGTEEKEQSYPLVARIHRSLRMAAGKPRQPIEAWLSYYQKGAGSANTAFSGAWAVQPNLDSSWAGWQAVFDEVKVVKCEIHYKVWNPTLATVAPAQTANMVVVYDPSNQTPLTSVNGGMEYEDFELLSLANNTNGANSSAVAPLPVTKDGFRCFRAKMPQGTQLSVVDTTVSTGMWRPTADATNYNWGFFQTYLSQGGTSCVYQIEAFVRMRCVFRTRR